jgi:hypothetical protein
MKKKNRCALTCAPRTTNAETCPPLSRVPTLAKMHLLAQTRCRRLVWRLGHTCFDQLKRRRLVFNGREPTGEHTDRGGALTMPKHHIRTAIEEKAHERRVQRRARIHQARLTSDIARVYVCACRKQRSRHLHAPLH